MAVNANSGAARNDSTHPALRLWRRLPLAARLFAAGFALIGLLILTAPEQEKQSQEERTWIVQEQRAWRTTHFPVLDLLGKVESPSAATYTAAINAFVIDVPVREGDWVIPGQLLVQLDDSEVKLLTQQREAELAEAEARIASELKKHVTDREALEIEQRLLKLQEDAVARMEKLGQSQLSAQKQIDDARQMLEQQRLAYANRNLAIEDHASRMQQLRAARDRAAALLSMARIELDRARIVATLPGRVSRVHVAHGDTVNAGRALISVFSERRLEVRAQVPDRYLPMLRMALAAEDEPLPTRDIAPRVRLPYPVTLAATADTAMLLERNPCLFIDMGAGVTMPQFSDGLMHYMGLVTAKSISKQIPLRLGHKQTADAKSRALDAVAWIDNRLLQLQLVRLSGSASSNTGGVDALFRIVGNTHGVELGRTLPLVLTLPPAPDTIAVPPQALHGLNRVYIIDGERLRGIDVQRLGFTHGNTPSSRNVLIRSNAIQTGERMMVSQLPQAINGLRVSTPVNRCALQASP